MEKKLELTQYPAEIVHLYWDYGDPFKSIETLNKAIADGFLFWHDLSSEDGYVLFATKTQVTKEIAQEAYDLWNSSNYNVYEEINNSYIATLNIDELNLHQTEGQYPEQIARLTWDWKDQLDIKELSKATSQGFVYWNDIENTGGDGYATVGTKEEITPELAQELYTLCDNLHKPVYYKEYKDHIYNLAN